MVGMGQRTRTMAREVGAAHLLPEPTAQPLIQDRVVLGLHQPFLGHRLLTQAAAVVVAARKGQFLALAALVAGERVGQVAVQQLEPPEQQTLVAAVVVEADRFHRLAALAAQAS